MTPLVIAILLALTTPALASPDSRTRAVQDAERLRRSQLKIESSALAEAATQIGCDLPDLAVAVDAAKQPVFVAHVQCGGDTFFTPGCDTLAPDAVRKLRQLRAGIEKLQPAGQVVVLVTGSVDKLRFDPARRRCSLPSVLAPAVKFWRAIQPPGIASTQDPRMCRLASNEGEICRRVLNQRLAAMRAEAVARALRDVPPEHRMPVPNITAIPVGLDEAWLHAHEPRPGITSPRLTTCLPGDCPNQNGDWQRARRVDIFALVTSSKTTPLLCLDDSPLVCLEDAAQTAVSSSGYIELRVPTSAWSANDGSACLTNLKPALATSGMPILWSLAMDLLGIKESDTCKPD